ncbi:MAG: hypothetical protein MUE85_21210 [Microscillaceae bacterium]|jgi:hypothetical protein|nr:hypothetical protein [Microscillaceae bacterium]
MKIGKVFDRLFEIVQEPIEDLVEIKELLRQAKQFASEIDDDNLYDWVNEFSDNWLSEGFLENDFEVFSGELNELVVELGNAGYFDDLA